MFKFRREPGDETDGSPVHGNIPLEILWTSIPAVIVLGLAIYSFEVYTQIGGLEPNGAFGRTRQAHAADGGDAWSGDRGHVAC